MLVYLQAFGYTSDHLSNLWQSQYKWTKYEASLVECDEKQCAEILCILFFKEKSGISYIFIFQPASTVYNKYLYRLFESISAFFQGAKCLTLQPVTVQQHYLVVAALSSWLFPSDSGSTSISSWVFLV